MATEEIHERLSVIDVKRDLRNKIRKLKGDQTYDKFLRELVKNTENSRQNSQHKQTQSTKKGDVI